MNGYFLPWHNQLIEHGRILALRQPFSDYFPAYFELTALASLLDGHLSRLSQLKLLPFCFDLLAAWFSYLLVRTLQASRSGLRQGVGPQIAAVFVVLAGPTVILNGVIGTADIIYVSWLLLTVYLLCSGRGAWAPLAYGVAFAFKLQSIFLAPFFFAMLLRRRIPRWSLILLPVGWILSLLPPIILGGSPWAFVTRFAVQANELNALAINVANPWEIANFIHFPYHAGILLGLGLTTLAGLAVAALGLRPGADKPHAVAALAALSLLAMPYVMPKMHDRYFFACELLLSILACVDLAFLAPAALVISASLISYAGYFTAILRHSATSVGLIGTSIALFAVTRGVLHQTRGTAPTEDRTLQGGSVEPG